MFDDLLRTTISLFAVINPIGTIPLFASMIQKMQKVDRDRVLKATVITASALVMNFTVAGTQ
ncbi:MarC family protein [Candidatus Nitrosocosmicus oleophilus]|uniref:MarC family protein n=1 Tax=Candidatus Nitrosocosmicus oleophilus TaxID=1353260 RepID=UPI003CC82939